MKAKQIVNLLLIALFVWAFQSTNIQHKHHVLEDISECMSCEQSAKLTFYQHSSPTLAYEQLAVKVRKYAEKIAIKSRYDYLEEKPCKRLDSIIRQGYSVDSIPLGYHATAPPFFTA